MIFTFVNIHNKHILLFSHSFVSNSFGTPWTVAYQGPLSTFSRQEYWSGFPFPSPGDLPDPGIKSGSPVFQADSLPSEPPGKPHNTCRKNNSVNCVISQLKVVYSVFISFCCISA